MDPAEVYRLFTATYHPDPNIHKQAELSIRHIEGNAGFLPIILQILISSESELGARQAAAIYFKNSVTRCWDITKQPKHQITDQDRAFIRANILHALVVAPPAVRIQLAASLNKILSVDFPEQWPDYVDGVVKLLQTQDANFVYTGLLALREVVKVYQWGHDAKRAPLVQIIKMTFPLIQGIAANLVQEDPSNNEAAEMIKICFKIYYQAILVELAVPLQDGSSLIPWGTTFVQVVDKEIPNKVLPEDDEERQKVQWWKAKKWAIRCLNRLFSRYGNPASLPASDKKYHAFAKNFVVHFAPNVLQSYLRQVELWSSRQIFISDKCLALISNFLTDAVRQKTTWQMLKPHTESIVAHYIFPQLCFSKSDEELWSEDAVEFVHKRVDPLEDFDSPTVSATSLLLTLAKDRRKHTFMSILAFINNILSQYQDAPTEKKNPTEKDGALCMIGSLSDSILVHKSPLGGMMEPFFVNHIFPEFKSPVPYLRYRACEIAKQFSDLEFSNPQNLATLYDHVSNCLRDPELPVRVQAALALQVLIRHEAIREAMVPNLAFIMQSLLQMTNEIDVDTLSPVMDDFVEIFADQLSPFAVQLAGQLRDTFLRIMEDVTNTQTAIEGNADAFDDTELDGLNDKTLAALGVLKTICTLIISVEASAEVLKELEQELIPVITFTLERRIVDLYDEVFEIIDGCTFSSKMVSPTMWRVLDLIYACFMDSGAELMEGIVECLDNYISLGNETFVSSSHYQNIVFEIAKTYLTSDRFGEYDRVNGCKIVAMVLLFSPGHVDQFVPHYLDLAFQHLANKIKTPAFKVHCLEIVVNCIYYNPMLTLQLLEEKGWTNGFFTLWFQSLGHFTRVFDKKLTIIALCAMLELPFQQIPATLQQGWSQVLRGIITTFSDLPKAMKNRQELEELFSGEFDDDDGDEEALNEAFSKDDFDDADNDDDVKDDDAEYLDYLAQQAAQVREGLDNEDEFDEDLEEEEVLFETPLDDINPYVVFEAVFRNLQHNNPQSYSTLTKDLDADGQAEVMKILTEASNAANQPAKA